MADTHCTCLPSGIPPFVVRRMTCPVHGVPFPEEVKEATGKHVKTPADYWDEGYEHADNGGDENDNPYR